MSTRHVVGITQFGGPEALGVHEVASFAPSDGEVSVAVHAAAVNPTDTGFRSGGYGAFDWPAPWVPGMDAAGTVVAVGDGVEQVAIGDRVMAAVAPAQPRGGAYTDLLTLPVDQVAVVPDGVSLDQAATLPMNGITAKVSLDRLALPEGATLGVTGAAGRLGSAMIALAHHRGLRVIADASEADEDLVRSFGADVVVPRGPQVGAAMHEASDGGVDGLLDAALQGDQVLPAVRDDGGIAAVRTFEGQPERGIEVHQVLVFDHLDDREAFTTLQELAAAEAISMIVADHYSPDQASDAHRRFEQGGVRGRLLLVF